MIARQSDVWTSGVTVAVGAVTRTPRVCTMSGMNPTLEDVKFMKYRFLMFGVDT